MCHRARLEKLFKLNANDRPAQKGQEVSIIRYEHGWIDGNWSGTVMNAYKQGECWSYSVRIEEMDEETLSGPEQFYVDIAHTRDLSF